MAAKKKYDRTKQKETLVKVLEYIKHYRAVLVFSLILAAVTVACTLYLPILTGDAINLILSPGQVDFNGIKNQTVLIVANALVNIQSGYFLYDDELYPCTLSQLASETGFHESTISRTLNNKYYSFNGEAYPLKKLLVSQTASGDSSDSIKKAIVELVDDEDKEHPLSDNQILKKLEELELHCSRRVIVKYRQQLNIPSSTKRKMLKKVG